MYYAARDLNTNQMIGYDEVVSSCECCGTTIEREYTVIYPTYPLWVETSKGEIERISSDSSFPYTNIEIVELNL